LKLAACSRHPSLLLFSLGDGIEPARSFQRGCLLKNEVSYPISGVLLNCIISKQQETFDVQEKECTNKATMSMLWPGIE
jgi:hypothetical protein